jgi:hypothetical protein
MMQFGLGRNTMISRWSSRRALALQAWILMVAAAAGGCGQSLGVHHGLGGGGTGGAAGATGGGGATTECPTCYTPCTAHDLGSPCAHVWEECFFGDKNDCSYENWYCDENHTWTFDTKGSWDECCVSTCGCPDDPPEDGASCNPDYDAQNHMTCYYKVETPCGPQTASAICNPDGTWTTIEQPPPCACSAHPTIAECEADPDCRYLAVGCAAPALEMGGCFPKSDCAADLPCQDGTVCTPMNANVCTVDPCITCVTVGLCL